ncbi:MAG: hypothetical protein EBS68_14105 [Rhodobacteraceae bacterium]|jgi:hypothetical protein|nr:hypothetical protein [Paracoccaceae bacterium]
MIALVRLVVFGFLFLSVVYLGISIYSRSVRRGKLKLQWDEEKREGDRSAFIREGMEAYERSLRHKLILLVYIIPVIVIGTIIYITNYT